MTKIRPKRRLLFSAEVERLDRLASKLRSRADTLHRQSFVTEPDAMNRTAEKISDAAEELRTLVRMGETWV